MTREQMKQRLNRSRQEPFVMTNLQAIPTRTDPRFALTGKQIFVATMQGLPLPEPPMLEFTGVKCDQIGALDKVYMDKFERLQMAKAELKQYETSITQEHTKYQQTKIKIKDEKQD